MPTFRKKIANSLWHLTIVIEECELTIKEFKDYLATGSKQSWDMYIMHYCFSLNFAKIIDDRLTPHVELANKLLDFHQHLDKYHDYSKQHDPKDAQRVLTILEILLKESTKFWIMEVNRYRLVNKLASMSEADLERCIKEVLDFEENQDPDEMVPFFAGLTKAYLKQGGLGH